MLDIAADVATSAVLSSVADGLAVLVATVLGLGEATVRTHLRALFAMTGRRRQAELARLMLKG